MSTRVAQWRLPARASSCLQLREGRSDVRRVGLSAQRAPQRSQELRCIVDESRSRRRTVGFSSVRASSHQHEGGRDASRGRSPSPRPSTSGQLPSGEAPGARSERDVSAKALSGAQRAEGGFLGVIRTHRRKVLPMCALFFACSFANALLDPIADTLVVTSFGGAEQIPFLSLYGVLPSSFLFVMGFAWLSNVLSRRQVFNLIVGLFLGFFTLWTGVLYPLRDSLQPHAVTDYLLRVLPASAAPGVAVLHNWTFTLFYIFSELWGDVVLSLMFWRFASEITEVEEAHIIYPLFGLGANVAQCCAGIILKQLPNIVPGPWEFQLRCLMGGVLTAGVCILGLHALICERAKELGWGNIGRTAAARTAAASGSGVAAAVRQRIGLRDTFKLLAASPQMLCLAAMSVSQGLSSNVFQVAWKRSIGDLFPNPAHYSAFMGDVQTVSALATCTAMLLAPLAFARLGWARTAAFTPKALMVLGWAFFGACMWVNGGLLFSSHRALLPALVLGGAGVYVFEKASKFALLKPAEEMVYLGLDDASRTNGKAAVDVCATQVGKAGGSLFQQGLLVGFGSLAAATPALLATHTGMVGLWLHAVSSLAHYHGHLLGHVSGARKAAAPAPEAEFAVTADLACDLPPGGSAGGAPPTGLHPELRLAAPQP